MNKKKMLNKSENTKKREYKSKRSSQEESNSLENFPNSNLNESNNFNNIQESFQLNNIYNNDYLEKNKNLQFTNSSKINNKRKKKLQRSDLTTNDKTINTICFSHESTNNKDFSNQINDRPDMEINKPNFNQIAQDHLKIFSCTHPKIFETFSSNCTGYKTKREPLGNICSPDNSDRKPDYINYIHSIKENNNQNFKSNHENINGKNIKDYIGETQGQIQEENFKVFTTKENIENQLTNNNFLDHNINFHDNYENFDKYSENQDKYFSEDLNKSSFNYLTDNKIKVLNNSQNDNDENSKINHFEVEHKNLNKLINLNNNNFNSEIDKKTCFNKNSIVDSNIYKIQNNINIINYNSDMEMDKEENNQNKFSNEQEIPLKISNLKNSNEHSNFIQESNSNENYSFEICEKTEKSRNEITQNLFEKNNTMQKFIHNPFFKGEDKSFNYFNNKNSEHEYMDLDKNTKIEDEENFITENIQNSNNLQPDANKDNNLIIIPSEKNNPKFNFRITNIIKQKYRTLEEIEKQFDMDKLEIINESTFIYRKNFNYMANQSFIQSRMRKILLDWIIEVTSQLHFKRQTFHLTVALLDSFLTLYHNLELNKLQLTGVTCLIIASKFEEVMIPNILTFASSTENSCTHVDIIRHEQLILSTLNWNIDITNFSTWVNHTTVNWDKFSENLSQFTDDLPNNNVILPKFREGNMQSYNLFRTITQYVDIISLDVEYLLYSERLLCLSLIYLLMLKVYDMIDFSQIIFITFEHLQHLHDFNLLFNRYLFHYYDSNLNELIHHIQYVSCYFGCSLLYNENNTMDENVFNFFLIY